MRGVAPMPAVSVPGVHAVTHDPAWRHALATRAVSGGRAVRDFSRLTSRRTDGRLRRHEMFLQRLRACLTETGSHVEFPLAHLQYAADYAAWRMNPGASGHADTEGISAYMEAMLLSDAPLSSICVDLGINPDVVRAYEAAYYNVRGANGEPVLPGFRRVTIALNGGVVLPANASAHMTWRYVGAVSGYRGLRVFVGMADANHPDTLSDMRAMLKRMLLQQLSASVISGKAKVLDMSTMLETLLKDERDTAALKARQQPGAQEAHELLMEIMGMLGPHISNEHNDSDIARALAAFATGASPAGAQEVTPTGATYADVTDAALRNKLKTAVDRQAAPKNVPTP